MKNTTVSTLQQRSEDKVRNDTRPMQNVDRAMAKGALWMILARLGDRSLGLISTLLLVRLLAPADFGLVAMGMSVIAMAELFGQVGLDIALIQNLGATRLHYDTAWTIGVILSTAISLAILAAAFPAVSYYDDTRLFAILLALAIGSFISGFENIGTVAFRKELRFNREFVFCFGKKLAGFVVTIPLAFLFRSYWALVAGIIASRLAGVCLSYWMQDYRPTWSLAARKELFHFSKWMVVSNFVTVVNARAADFILGKIAGAHALGIFNVSYEVSNLPTSELIAPINRAAFPGYAQMSAQPNGLQEGYLNVIGVIAAFGIPAAFGIAATSDWLVPLVLGEQWLEAIPLVSILAFYGVLAAMKTNAHYIYLALGRPQIATYLGLVQISLMLPILGFLSATYGAIGAAYAYLVSQAVFTPLSFAVLFRVLRIGIRELFLVVWRPTISAILMYMIIRIGMASNDTHLTANASNLAYLLTAVGVGIVTYVACLYILWTIADRPAGTESRLLGLLRSSKLWSRVRNASVLS